MALPVTSNLQLWLDASQITGVADGAALSSWPDMSGNSNTATAGGTTPIYRKNQLGGLPAVTFGGAGYYALTSGLTATERTVFVVQKNSSTGAKGTFLGGPLNSFAYWTCGSGSQQGIDKQGAAQILNGAAAADTVWHYMGARYTNGGAQTLKIDGAVDANQAFTSISATAASDQVGRSSLAGGSEYLNGQLVELIYYDRALSDAEIGQVETYLNNKYFSQLTLRGTSKANGSNSITISLPTGSVAGDLAILWVTWDWTLTAPSGWTLLQGSVAGTAWNEATFTKTLTGSDITAGSVSLSLSGSANSLAMMATLYGSSLSPGSSVDIRSNARGSTAGTAVALSDTAGGKRGDLAFYFGSNLTTSTDTVSRGVSQQTRSGGNSGCLFSEVLAADAAPLAPTFNYSVSASSFQSVVVVGVMNSNARVTQFAREVAITSNPAMRFTYLSREVGIVIPAVPTQQPIIQVIT